MHLHCLDSQVSKSVGWATGAVGCFWTSFEPRLGLVWGLVSVPKTKFGSSVRSIFPNIVGFSCGKSCWSMVGLAPALLLACPCLAPGLSLPFCCLCSTLFCCRIASEWASADCSDKQASVVCDSWHQTCSALQMMKRNLNMEVI